MKLDVTVHGFHATFRDWAIEKTGSSWDAIETSFAQMVGNAVSQAYMRTDLHEARRRLVESLTQYLAPAADNVRSIRS